MTIDELRRVIRDLPGDARVFISTAEDDCGPSFVTWEKSTKILRLVSFAGNIPDTETVLEDYSGASGQFGVGA